MYIDLTGVASAVIAGVFSIASIVIPMIIASHMKDKQAATVLSNAVQNALGAIQQAAVIEKKPPDIKDGVNYVVNHAGPEIDRLGLTKDLIADKISAKQGLQSLAVATAQAVQPPITIPVVAVNERPAK